MADNTPAHRIRSHSAEAVIWANQTTKGARYSAMLGWILKEGDNWRTTDGLGRDDPLVARKAPDTAHGWPCESQQ